MIGSLNRSQTLFSFPLDPPNKHNHNHTHSISMQAVPSSEAAAAAAAAAAQPPSSNSKDPHYGSLALSSSFEEEEDVLPSQQPQLLVSWQGVALLTADCLGVGVLALPNDIAVLGISVGLGFLILNFPINFVAGDYLSQIALSLETTIPKTAIRRQPQLVDNSDEDEDDENSDHHDPDHDHDNDDDDDDLVELVTLEAPIGPPPPLPLTARDESSTDTTNLTTTIHHRRQIHIHKNNLNSNTTSSAIESFQDEPDHEDHDPQPPRIPHDQHHLHHHPDTTTTATHDLIGISTAIFHSPKATSLVIGVYYCNLFLVLGDYILVMGRAMSAMTLDTLCLPVAGGIASILMFGICQFRTMALLGRKVSLASLLAMWIVLLQCLFHHRTTTTTNNQDTTTNDSQVATSIWTKFSALAGIGFAVGSQKLFLNIRHELAVKEEASKVLAGSLTTYGLVYVAVVLLAGPNPPSFLFDAIPEGWSRQVAGFLLWGHVAVSYAINSQALCSSMDRFLLAASGRGGGWHTLSDAKRWFWLTLTVVISSYLVSNAVPFFKDLVALIGALTSVPLTLTLPALLYRKFHRMRLYFPVWKQQQQQQQGGGEPRGQSPESATTTSSSSSRRLSCGSFPLLVYSIVFLGVGLAGALSSIDEDWLNQGRPFACR